jgi:hypothetical protein
MSFRCRPLVSSSTRVAWALTLLAVGTACRSKKAPPPPPSPTAASSAPVAAAPPRCRPLAPGGLVVGNASGPAKSNEDDELELPFATATGSAVALPDGFAVSGVAERDGKSEAFVAFVPGDGKPGKSVFLGAVHGDPEPPLVAADAEAALVAVATSDASGRVLELVRVAANAEAPVRGSEITDVGEEGAALAVGETSGVLVFSARKAGKSALRAAVIARGAARAAAPFELAETADAESPIVRARPGGFWLAWIAEKSSGDAGARGADAGGADAGGEETRPLDIVPRVLVVALLGADGTPRGAPRPVSAPDSHVIAFDAETLADGTLALAWREDAAVPGVESGGNELARVAPDGAVARGRAADETLSAGAPALVRESGAPHRVWLLAPGEDDRLRMALLAPDAVATSPFVADEALRGGEILAALAGKPCGKETCATLLVARPKNRAVELGVTECRP